MRLFSLAGALALAASALATGNARAAVFDFAYTIPSGPDTPTAVSASGVLTADPTGAPGAFLITSIAGTRNGEAITGLVRAGELMPTPNDNLVYTTEPHITEEGIAYRVAGPATRASGPPGS